MDYTTGPWTADRWNETLESGRGPLSRSGFTIYMGEKQLATTLQSFTLNGKPAEKDSLTHEQVAGIANMMAAAPEMYQLLSEIASTYGSRSEIGKRLKAVLNKAKPKIKS